MDSRVILEMRDIRKTFPGVTALDGVNLTVTRGEIHGLMGENGAGKSTLIKVLTGVYQKDGGAVLLEGTEIHPKSPQESQGCGISTIYQELNLIPYISVAENIFLGDAPKKRGAVDWGRMYRDAQELIGEMGLHIDVWADLQRYSTAIQQMVAIVRAVRMNARLLVMDEPTSSLDASEVRVLLGLMKRLRDAGTAILFISHRLDEIYEVCDRVTILKDGRGEGTYPLGELSRLALIRKMVGREYAELSGRGRPPRKLGEEYLCELRDITRGLAVRGVSFGIHKGEILGLAGLLGSGRTETVKILFGCDMPSGGEIFHRGGRVRIRGPRDAVRLGFAFCPEDRRVEGIVPNMSVEDNVALASLPALSGRLGWIRAGEKAKLADEYIQRLGIKTPGRKQAIRNLSGGNQQKVILARWLCMHPALIILDEPTRGIDVGAKAEIEKMIGKFADEGISVLMISSELSELVRSCERVVVMREGEKVGELSAGEISEDHIMRMIAGEGGRQDTSGEGSAC